MLKTFLFYNIIAKTEKVLYWTPEKGCIKIRNGFKVAFDPRCGMVLPQFFKELPHIVLMRLSELMPIPCLMLNLSFVG